MSEKVTLNVPLNRVEGDLELQVEIDAGIVTDAWSSGTMYRGFENILVGRGALDGLVITPRVCGICGTAHITAAARALDMISEAQVPPGAEKVRNLALMTENLQSDMRHGFLMFAVDFANPVYRDEKLFDEAVRRYEPLKGETVVEVIKETKKVIEIIATLGGQWPHSSYMVPGGITSVPSTGDLLQCRHFLRRYRKWYEDRILGCSLERWLDVKSGADLEGWLEENNSHRDSDLGFYIRFSRQIGLDTMGKGHGNFISYGAFPLPLGTQVQARSHGEQLVPAGFAQGTRVSPLDQAKISEHVAHSWFEDYDGGRHPFDGETRPYATGRESIKYSWAKAPRYQDRPAETGPLAEMIMAGNPLFVDLVETRGVSVFVRELARLVRPAETIPAMEIWLSELAGTQDYYQSPGLVSEGSGFGLTNATRGALGHWVVIRDGRIAKYQIITPTAWHASPRDSNGTRGAWEEALVGTPVRDLSNPVELGHVVRSFDACLVCTVHAIRTRSRTGMLILDT
ncbi:MAG: nickel-dependent hydrogenase large subunit [Deltaproteobacteria bacterium]|nr:nickel-dependent hydrogenase large subunit [Deltaproteobacteria bacterium]